MTNPAGAVSVVFRPVKPPNGYVQMRMRTRHITAAEIDEVLASPQTRYPSKTNPDRSVVLGQTSRGRRLKVVTLSADPEYVITVADRDMEV